MKKIDITGQRFGKLTAIKETNDPRKWVVECDCGTVKEVWKSHLVYGKTTSCGCSQYSHEDLTGQKFGKLTVIKKDDRQDKKHTFFICECECGNIISARSDQLKSGRTKTCRCIWQGDTHPQWKGGVSQEYNRFNTYKEWKEYRQAVFNKYGGAYCQKCGVKSNKQGGHRANLHIHHIMSYVDHPELVNDVDNGIPLCIDCHNAFHSKYGRGYNNMQQLIEFLTDGAACEIGV